MKSPAFLFGTSLSFPALITLIVQRGLADLALAGPARA
jgi:hypothetical protein